MTNQLLTPKDRDLRKRRHGVGSNFGDTASMEKDMTRKAQLNSSDEAAFDEDQESLQRFNDEEDTEGGKPQNTADRSVGITP